MKYLPLQILTWNHSRIVAFAIVLTLLSASCESVKPYQRAYLNDENMQPGSAPCEGLDDNVFSYREGSVVTGGDKTRGGCGCN